MASTAEALAAQKKKKSDARQTRRQALKTGEVVEPGKRGNPGNFSGPRLDRLLGVEEDYLKAAGGGRGTIPVFLTGFMHEWWKIFPWYDGLNPEKPLDGDKLVKIETPDVTALDASDALDTFSSNVVVGPGSGNGADEQAKDIAMVPAAGGSASAGLEEEPDLWSSTGGVDPSYKDRVETIIANQIKSWFSHRKTLTNRSRKNPFEQWLLRFRHSATAPRKQALHKFYMNHTEYSKKVDARFTEMWPSQGLEQKYALDFRCKCAKTLLEEETEEIQAEVAAKVDELHAKAVERYESQAEGIANPAAIDEEGQADCRRNLAQVVQPFLNGISKLTGYHVTLLAGAGPPEGSVKYSLTTLHAGRTYVPGLGREGLKFDEWEIDLFKRNVMGQFMRFLLETNPHSATSYTISGDGENNVDDEKGESVAAVEEVSAVDVGTEEGERGRKKKRAPAKGKGKGKRRASRSETPVETPESSRDRSLSSRSSSRSSREPTVPPPDPEDEADGWTSTPELPHTHLPGPELLAELAALPTQARRRQISRLGDLCEYEFNRESNIARNKVMAAAFRAEAVADGLFPPTLERGPPVAKKKVLLIGPQRTSKRLTRGKDIAPLLLDAEGDIVMEDVELHGEEARERTEQTAGKATAATAEDVEAAKQKKAVPRARPAWRERGVAAVGGMESVGEVEETPDSTEKVGVCVDDAAVGAAGQNDAQRPVAHAQEPVARTEDADDRAARQNDADGGDRGEVASRKRTGGGEVGGNMMEEGVDCEGWAQWMTDGYAVLDKCAGGQGWRKVITTWTILERAYGFKTSNKPLPTEGRPTAVKVWCKYGRKINKPPQLSLPEFSQDWWNWWAALAPAWRVKDASGRPLAGNNGPWGNLIHPGANGILMVLVALVWWRDAESAEDASADWQAALDDVSWVLEGLLAEARKRPQPSTAATEFERPAKRRKSAV